MVRRDSFRGLDEDKLMLSHHQSYFITAIVLTHPWINSSRRSPIYRHNHFVYYTALYEFTPFTILTASYRYVVILCPSAPTQLSGVPVLYTMTLSKIKTLHGLTIYNSIPSYSMRANTSSRLLSVIYLISSSSKKYQFNKRYIQPHIALEGSVTTIYYIHRVTVPS